MDWLPGSSVLDLREDDHLRNRREVSPSSLMGTQDRRCSGPQRDFGHVPQGGQLLCGINSLASVNGM